MWNSYRKGNLNYHEDIEWSIDAFRNQREQLEAIHPDDLSDDRVRQILTMLSNDRELRKLGHKLILP